MTASAAQYCPELRLVAEERGEQGVFGTGSFRFSEEDVLPEESGCLGEKENLSSTNFLS